MACSTAAKHTAIWKNAGLFPAYQALSYLRGQWRTEVASADLDSQLPGDDWTIFLTDRENQRVSSELMRKVSRSSQRHIVTSISVGLKDCRRLSLEPLTSAESLPHREAHIVGRTSR